MIAPFLLCVFAACFSKFVYGKLYNPSTVFFLIWMLLLAFSRLGLFGVPVPNSDTYLLLFIGLFSFFVGFVSVDLKKWYLSDNPYILKKNDHTFGETGFWAPQWFSFNNMNYLTYTANEQTVRG